MTKNGPGAAVAVLFVLACAAAPARGVDCSTPPTDGYKNDYPIYEEWCRCCGGKAYNSPGIGCTRGPNWGRTTCSGNAGATVTAPPVSYSQKVMETAARTGYVDPQAAVMAGTLDMLNLFKAGSQGSQQRQAEAELARQRKEELERQREAEIEERKNLMHRNLVGKLKTDRPAALGGRFDNDGRPVDVLKIKTGNDTFPGLRRDRGGDLLARLKRDEDEDEDKEEKKKASDKAAGLELKDEPSPFDRLAKNYKDAQEKVEKVQQEVSRLEKAIEARKAELRKKPAPPETGATPSAPAPAARLKTEAPENKPDEPKAAEKKPAEEDKTAQAEKQLREAEEDDEELKRLEEEVADARRQFREAKGKEKAANDALRAHLQKESKGAAKP